MTALGPARREPGMAKISKRDQELFSKIVLIPPRRWGKINPKLMRKALQELYKRRAQEEAEAKAKARARKKAEANGHSDPVEAE
jgi:hypothetical protein